MLVSSLSVWPRLAYPSWISLWTTESRTLSVFQDGIWTNIEIHWRYISKQQLNYFSFSHRGIYFCTPCFTLAISVLPLSLSYLKADLVLSLLGVALDGVGRRHRRRVDVAVIRHDQTVAPVVHLQTGQMYLYLCFSLIYNRWRVIGDIGETIYYIDVTCDMW